MPERVIALKLIIDVSSKWGREHDPNMGNGARTSHRPFYPNCDMMDLGRGQAVAPFPIFGLTPEDFMVYQSSKKRRQPRFRISRRIPHPV